MYYLECCNKDSDEWKRYNISENPNHTLSSLVYYYKHCKKYSDKGWRYRIRNLNDDTCVMCFFCESENIK